MKQILLLSDFHTGSDYGLWPPDFTAKNDRDGTDKSFPQNPAQEAIWQHWEYMLEILDEEPPDCIIINGDEVEGVQRREYGRGLVTPDINIQAKACINIQKTLPSGIPVYHTQGTDYHETVDGLPIEKYIAEQTGGIFGDELIIEECGIRLFCRHAIGISQSTWQYMTTAPARDHMLLYLHKSKEKYGPIDIAVFSHRHQFVSAQFSSGIALVTPCWQGKTVFAVKKGIVSPPHIGWVSLHITNPKRIAIDTNGIADVVKPCQVVGRDVKK